MEIICPLRAVLSEKAGAPPGRNQLPADLCVTNGSARPWVAGLGGEPPGVVIAGVQQGVRRPSGATGHAAVGAGQLGDAGAAAELGKVEVRLCGCCCRDSLKVPSNAPEHWRRRVWVANHVPRAGKEAWHWPKVAGLVASRVPGAGAAPGARRVHSSCRELCRRLERDQVFLLHVKMYPTG